MVPASIPPKVAFELVHPKYTLPPYFPPLDDQAAGDALKLNTASCQFSYPFHFEAHRSFGPGSSPQYGFFDSIGHLNFFCSSTTSPTSLVRSRIACSIRDIGCGG